MFNHHDITRNAFMLHGPLAHHGYDWWWHSFTAQDAETGEDKPFFIEFFVCNPALAEEEPVLADGRDITMWQYTSKGRIVGISGYVDKSRFMGRHGLREIRYRH